jgi:hypothetical protein
MEFGGSGKSATWQAGRIESWSRAKSVAQGVEETNSPGSVRACVRGGSAGVVVCVTP